MNHSESLMAGDRYIHMYNISVYNTQIYSFFFYATVKQTSKLG